MNKISRFKQEYVRRSRMWCAERVSGCDELEGDLDACGIGSRRDWLGGLPVQCSMY